MKTQLQISIQLPPHVIQEARRAVKRKPVREDGKKNLVTRQVREWLEHGLRAHMERMERSSG